MKREYCFSDTVSDNPDELKKMTGKLLSHCLKKVRHKKPVILSATITDDPTIHQINKEYRGIDRPTDVISFAYDDEDSDADMPFDDMGEIIISLDTAIRQAAFYHHPVEREIAFLFIHSFLHLSGYDHLEPEEAEEMFSLQNEILDSFPYQYVDIRKKDSGMEKFDLKDEKLIHELYLDARKAMELSYSPYSHNRVGAVIWTKDGKKIFGANIENASYGLSMCAERTAMFRAHLEGVKKEDQIVIGIAADFKSYAWPCGACRQVMSELLPLDTPVFAFDKDGGYKEFAVKDSMVGIFTPDDLA